MSPQSTATVAGVDATGTEALGAAQDYKDAMNSWVEAYWYDSDGEPVHAPEIADLADPTHVEIAAARQFASVMREALTAVKAISPPDDVAQAHAQYCTALSGEVSALDRMISAIEWGSERDAELAMRGAEEARALEWQALKVLGPYIDAPGLTRN